MDLKKKTVFFDVGNVLLFFSHDKMCKQIAQFCSVEEKKIRSLLLENLGERYEKGQVSTNELYTVFCDLAKKELNKEHFLKAASDIFEPNSEIFPVIDSLKRKGVRLVVLSNTCEAHFMFAKAHYPILKQFDHYVLSYEIGARKPEKEIFTHALSHANCPKKNCFYTDDIPEYVLAARKEGLDSETYLTTDNLKEQLLERGFL